MSAMCCPGAGTPTEAAASAVSPGTAAVDAASFWSLIEPGFASPPLSSQNSFVPPVAARSILRI